MNPGATALAFLLAAGTAAPAFAQPGSPPNQQSSAPAQASAQDEQNTVGEISEDVAMVRFQKLGYQNVDIGAWTLSYQECAALRALLTFSMFSTPLVLSHSSKAFAPCFA